MSDSSDVHNESSPTTVEDEASTERTLLRTELARALKTEGFGSVKVLSHEAADRVFTPKRREILRILDEDEVSSQRDLARRLGRDPGAVQRDLQELIEADLVTIDTDGRSNRPKTAHDTIIVEPLIAPESAVPTATYTVENEP